MHLWHPMPGCIDIGLRHHRRQDFRGWGKSRLSWLHCTCRLDYHTILDGSSKEPPDLDLLLSTVVHGHS
jgi:hypothetical protein